MGSEPVKPATKAPTWLLDHQSDTYSQSGEDGIIAKILDTIGADDKWCVEFGAWDGMRLTNTRNLIESRGYSAVLVEPDEKKFAALQRNYADRQEVITINEFVGFNSDDNLDRILEPTPIPRDFDFLSIDIDGNDYHVWKAIARYEPKVVVVEFNPTIPTPVRFVQPADPAINQGASLLSLVELGREKGYELVAVLPFNAFFVRKELYPRFEMESNDPEILRTNLDNITWLFSGYDGKVFLQGNCQLPWHSIKLRESKVQHLPRLFRKYPANYTHLQRILYALYLAVTNPKTLKKAIQRRKRRMQRRGD